MSIIGYDSFELDPVAESAAAIPSELDHFHTIDFNRIYFDILKGKKLDTDVRSHVTDGSIEDSISETPNFKITIHDPDWELLNSGALSQAIDLKVGSSRWYRLFTVDVNDDDIICTFIIRNAAYLMHHNKKRKANRKNTTRAEFILRLVRSVKKVKIPFFCPQLHKMQPIESVRLHSDSHRRSGLPDKGTTHITVKGAEADSDQRKSIEGILAEGNQMGAPRLAEVGAIMCATQESTMRRSATAGQFVGLFQQSSRYGWPATRDARKDSHAFYKQFIPLVRKNPHADLGQLIARVQKPLHPAEYALGCDRWRNEAENTVDHYRGGGGGTRAGLSTLEFRKRYNFEIVENSDGTNENYLAATYRLADEVGWRAFWVGNGIHFSSEEDLFKSRARFRIERSDIFVEGISFTINEQRKANEMVLRVRMVRWPAPIGTVVVFGPKPGTKMVAGAKVHDNPANGRWLVTHISKPAFSELGEITLSKPIEEKLEPAPEIGVRQVDDGSGGLTSLGSSLGGAGAIDDSEGARSIVESLALIAGCPSGRVSGGSGIHVISDYRAGSKVPSGAPSDHSANDQYRAARDIGFDSINALTGPPPRQLDYAMKRIADALKKPYTPGDVVNWWNVHNWHNTGIRIQVGWRVGDHFGHIHVGAHFEGRPGIPAPQIHRPEL